MRYEVIVIGAGLGGLECACLLSQAGHSVLVLEKEHHVGGCLQSYRRRGLDYDTGFHYVGGLGEGQSLHEAFARLQLLDLPWHRLDEAYDRITIGDRTFSLVQGFDAFAGALVAEFPAEREALREYAGLLARVARDGGWEVRPADGNELLETGAWDYLSTRFRDPLLRDVLSGNALRMELRRESLPLFTFAHCNAGYVESSWRLRGPGSQYPCLWRRHPLRCRGVRAGRERRPAGGRPLPGWRGLRSGRLYQRPPSRHDLPPVVREPPATQVLPPPDGHAAQYGGDADCLPPSPSADVALLQP